MKTKQLSEDYAVVLQQLSEDGGDDFGTLAEMLNYEQSKLSQIVQSMHHKGLITVKGHSYNSWLTISSKGKRVMNYLWPESKAHYSH